MTEKVVEVEKEVVKEVEVEKKYKPLVIYSGRKESLVGPIIQAFTDATRIPVEVKYGKTGEMAATLMEEGDKTPADIFYAQDPGGLGSVEDMFAVLPSSITSKVPDWADSPNQKWTGITGRARVVVYNTMQLQTLPLSFLTTYMTLSILNGKVKLVGLQQIVHSRQWLLG